MKSKLFTMFAASVILCSAMTGCESGTPEMNAETSRPVMDEYINRDSYAIKVIYDDKNLEFYYAKDGDIEALITTMGGAQSAVFRDDGYTYYVDVVGQKEVRCIEGDTTDLNYACEMLNMIYKESVVQGEFVMRRELGTKKNPITVDNYTYTDTENDDSIIEWQLTIKDNMLIKALRINDNNSITFEYPEVDDSVFYIPEDYNIVGGPRPDFDKD